MNRAILSLVWIWAVGSFFVDSGDAVWSVGRVVCVTMLAAHVVECAVFRAKLRNAPGSLPSHIAQTLLFGFFHLRTLPEPGASAS